MSDPNSKPTPSIPKRLELPDFHRSLNLSEGNNGSIIARQPGVFMIDVTIGDYYDIRLNPVVTVGCKAIMDLDELRQMGEAIAWVVSETKGRA